MPGWAHQEVLEYGVGFGVGEELREADVRSLEYDVGNVRVFGEKSVGDWDRR